MTAQTPKAVNWLLRIPIDPMTYRSLVYLILAIPMGIAYFVLLVVGFSLSLGLLVLLVGPVVFVATLFAIIALVWFDGLLTEVVLNSRVDPALPSTESPKAFLKETVFGAATWKGIIYLGWKIILGFVAFVLLVVGFSVGISFLLTPLYYSQYLTIASFGDPVIINTFPRAMVVAVIGLASLYLTLVVVHVLGMVAGRIAERIFPRD